LIRNFPPINYEFDCYLNDDDNSVLLSLPHANAYILSLIIISIGYLFGILMILYSILYPYYSEKNTAYMSSLKSFISILILIY